MARLLVRLKLRLVANTVRLSTAAAIGVVLGALFGLGAGAAVGLAIAAAGPGTTWPDLVVVLFGALWVAWVVLPIVTFSTDDTLDPRRFTLLDLRPADLVPGLLAGGLVGIGPASTTVAAAGAVPGAARAGGGVVAVVVAVAGVVLLLVTCVATSRAVVTVLSDRLSTRRGRDVLAALVMVLTLVVTVGPQLLLSTTPGSSPTLPTAAMVARMAGILAWTPGGATGAAIGRAVTGDLAGAAARLLAVVAWTVAMVVAWALALRGLDRQPGSSTATAGSRGRLYPRSLSWLPRTRTTLVTVRFLRSLVRDPRVRHPALGTMVVVVPLLALVRPVLAAPRAPLYAAVLAVPFGLLSTTQFGYDGPALWLHVVTGDEARSDLVGRDLALWLGFLPLFVPCAVVLAATSGGWATLPAALVLGTATLGAMMGVGTAMAPLVAQPIPEEPSTAFGAGAAGSGTVQALLVLVVLASQVLALAPIAVAMATVDTPLSRLAVATGGLAYGATALVLGLGFAVRQVRRRGADLLQAVDPRTA